MKYYLGVISRPAIHPSLGVANGDRILHNLIDVTKVVLSADL